MKKEKAITNRTRKTIKNPEMGFAMSSHLNQRIRTYAKKKDLTISKVIRMALITFLITNDGY